MKDAAYILRHCNANLRCLVLMDELGRGTSNSDGSAIAWSVAEELAHKQNTKSFFVTHYPLLLGLPRLYEGCSNVHMSVDVAQGRLKSYRHSLRNGANVTEADYGIDLAQRIGVSATILEKAHLKKQRIIKAAPGGCISTLRLQRHSENASGSYTDNTKIHVQPKSSIEQLQKLRRRLMSLKGSSIDDIAFARYLDCMKQQMKEGF